MKCQWDRDAEFGTGQMCFQIRLLSWGCFFSPNFTRQWIWNWYFQLEIHTRCCFQMADKLLFAKHYLMINTFNVRFRRQIRETCYSCTEIYRATQWSRYEEVACDVRELWGGHDASASLLISTSWHRARQSSVRWGSATLRRGRTHFQMSRGERWRWDLSSLQLGAPTSRNSLRVLTGIDGEISWISRIIRIIFFSESNSIKTWQDCLTLTYQPQHD